MNILLFVSLLVFLCFYMEIPLHSEPLWIQARLPLKIGVGKQQHTHILDCFTVLQALTFVFVGSITKLTATEITKAPCHTGASILQSLTVKPVLHKAWRWNGLLWTALTVLSQNTTCRPCHRRSHRRAMGFTSGATLYLSPPLKGATLLPLLPSNNT